MAAAQRCLTPNEAEGSAEASVAHTFAVDSGLSLSSPTTFATAYTVRGSVLPEANFLQHVKMCALSKYRSELACSDLLKR
ncbi:hypothetical protein Y032_0168g190 [Ancylostoma ceylanicum]|uniref:Uncharacterized protein n=1 Tax=Ancylostoma ceylanicum TaxID=53326 RepID=A0A016SVI6_9BILA|nr:hypothetical protein Y032_0168g190 [Ancylostoma ceylanicum]